MAGPNPHEGRFAPLIDDDELPSGRSEGRTLIGLPSGPAPMGPSVGVGTLGPLRAQASAPANNPNAAPELGYWGTHARDALKAIANHAPKGEAEAKFNDHFRDYWEPDRAQVLASLRYTPSQAPSPAAKPTALGGLPFSAVSGLMQAANQRATSLRGRRLPEGSAEVDRQLAGSERDVFSPEMIQLAQARDFALPHPRIGFRDALILQELQDLLAQQEG